MQRAFVVVALCVALGTASPVPQNVNKDISKMMQDIQHLQQDLVKMKEDAQQTDDDDDSTGDVDTSTLFGSKAQNKMSSPQVDESERGGFLSNLLGFGGDGTGVPQKVFPKPLKMTSTKEPKGFLDSYFSDDQDDRIVAKVGAMKAHSSDFEQKTDAKAPKMSLPPHNNIKSVAKQTKSNGHSNTMTHGHSNTMTHGNSNTMTHGHSNTMTHGHSNTMTHQKPSAVKQPAVKHNSKTIKSLHQDDADDDYFGLFASEEEPDKDQTPTSKEEPGILQNIFGGAGDDEADDDADVTNNEDGFLAGLFGSDEPPKAAKQKTKEHVNVVKAEAGDKGDEGDEGDEGVLSDLTGMLFGSTKSDGGDDADEDA